jgi:hypothetical protein
MAVSVIFFLGLLVHHRGLDGAELLTSRLAGSSCG